jgi:hypothetical protein
MIYEYHDALLKGRVTDAIEAESVDYIAQLGEIPTFWAKKLIVSYAYIITATRHQTQAGDIYAEKIKTYSAQYASELKEARMAQEKINASANPAKGFTSLSTREIEIG